MRYFVNGRFLTQRLTGVQRYAYEVTVRLARLLPEVRVLVPAGTRVPAELAPFARRVGVAQGYIWEQLELAAFVSRNGGRLWSPGNVGPALLAPEKHIVTIHDTFGYDGSWDVAPLFHMAYRVLLPILAKRSLIIFTVSEYSRRCIADSLGVSPEKIRVAYNGVDCAFYPRDTLATTAVRRRYGLPPRFVLVLGSVEPRKNLTGALRAWMKLDSQVRIPLVVAGGLGAHRVFGRNADRIKGALGVASDVVMLGYVPDEDLPALYSACSVFFYPSFAEGFGLPVLEALSCGARVVTSKGTALEELFAGIATLVDPYSDEDIAQGLHSALSRIAPRMRGASPGQQFSWENTARAILEGLTEGE